jgi:hypothetical protein
MGCEYIMYSQPMLFELHSSHEWLVIHIVNWEPVHGQRGLGCLGGATY